MKTILSLLVCSFLLSFQARAVGPIVIAGTGNPASVLCDQVGGRLVGVETSAGKTTLCAIGNAMVEQWTLHAALHNQTLEQATQALLNSSDCRAENATIVTGKNTETGKKIQMCRFSDDSLIELKTLQGGTQAEGNQLLIQMISEALKN